MYTHSRRQKIVYNHQQSCLQLSLIFLLSKGIPAPKNSLFSVPKVSCNDLYVSKTSQEIIADN